MPAWLGFSLLALMAWGVVGLTQKLTTNRISADGAIIWCTVGSWLLMPWFYSRAQFSKVAVLYLVIGLGAGFAARLGEWFLFACMKSGAKASIAVPLTSTYPCLTLLLAITFLAERLTAIQWTGIVLALAAAALMSYEPESAVNRNG